MLRIRSRRSTNQNCRKITIHMLEEKFHYQLGHCYNTNLLMMPNTNSPWTISTELCNTRKQYLMENEVLVIVVMNCTKCSGGLPFWQMKGEKDNRYDGIDINHHEAKGWSRQMVEELGNKYCFVAANNSMK